MLRVDVRSPIPIHEQVKSGLRELVMKGQLKPGDSLPATADLAETLLISPQAVSRAYRELAKEGLLELRRDGPAISRTAHSRAFRKLADVVQQFMESVESATWNGLSWEDLESILQMLKSQDLQQKENVVPSIFKKLYFDAVTGRSDKAMCPYCREGIADASRVVSCLLCRTVHHQECWEETGHCSVFGCKGRVRLRT